MKFNYRIWEHCKLFHQVRARPGRQVTDDFCLRLSNIGSYWIFNTRTAHCICSAHCGYFITELEGETFGKFGGMDRSSRRMISCFHLKRHLPTRRQKCEVNERQSLTDSEDVIPRFVTCFLRYTNTLAYLLTQESRPHASTIPVYPSLLSLSAGAEL